jgi:hypothetical protein
MVRTSPRGRCFVGEQRPFFFNESFCNSFFISRLALLWIRQLLHFR